MNRLKTEPGTKDIANSVYYSPRENFNREVKKIKDMAVLKELWLMAYQKDEKEMIKTINKRIQEAS